MGRQEPHSTTLPVLHYGTDHLDEARVAVKKWFYPHRLTPVEHFGGFAMSLDAVRLGDLTIGRLEYDHAVMSLDFGELEDSYHFSVPLSGQVEAVCSGQETISTPQCGAIYLPEGRTVISRWSAGCAQYGVKFDRHALERELQQLLGHSVRSPIRFAPIMHIAGGATASWWRLVCTVVADLACGEGLSHNPLVAGQLGRAITTGLLLAADHDYREELDQPRLPARPRSVRRVIDAIETSCEQPFTVVDLAALAGTSVRGLQDAFHKYVGTPPMAYLRDIRLDRVHGDLLAADPTRTSVSDVAIRWGFRHLGRFAADYRHKYGETPSYTLSTGN